MAMDPTVPYQQSVDLHKKLEEAGVKTRIHNYTGRNAWSLPPG